MHKSIRIACLATVICMLCTLTLPSQVQAVDTSADAVADESPHIINSVNLRDDAGMVLTAPVALNPQGSYQIEVTVTDNNLLSDIDQVEVVLYYDSDGTSPAPNYGHAATAAVLTWDRDAPSPFSLDAGTSSTWALDELSCAAPADDQSTGSWVFGFTVGDTAHETETALDEWRLEVRVLDEPATTPLVEDTFNTGETTFEMNHYSRLESVTLGVSFGHALPGGVLPNTPLVELTAVANGMYTVEMGVNETWSGLNGNSLTTVTSLTAPQQIRLMARGGADLSLDTAQYGDPSLKEISTVPTPLKGLMDVPGPTAEVGDAWQVKVTARFSSSVREDTYRGVIYLTVGDSSGDE